MTVLGDFQSPYCDWRLSGSFEIEVIIISILKVGSFGVSYLEILLKTVQIQDTFTTFHLNLIA